MNLWDIVDFFQVVRSNYLSAVTDLQILLMKQLMNKPQLISITTYCRFYSVVCALCIEWALTPVLWDILMFYPNCSNTGFSLLIYYSTFYTNTTYCISVTSSLINRPIINLISSSCCLFTVSSAGPVRWRTYHVPAPRYCPVINTAFASDWPNLSTDFIFFYSGLVFLFLFIF